MKESEGVRSALLRFYDRNAANDQAAFPSGGFSRPATVLVIGSAAREWFAGQRRGPRRLRHRRFQDRRRPGPRLRARRARLRRQHAALHRPERRALLKLRMTTVFVTEGRRVEAPPHARLHAGPRRGAEWTHQDDWWAERPPASQA